MGVAGSIGFDLSFGFGWVVMFEFVKMKAVGAAVLGTELSAALEDLEGEFADGFD